MKSVLVKFFNAQGVVDPFVSEIFSVENGEYDFAVNENGDLHIRQWDEVGNRKCVAIFASGHWASVEFTS